MTRALQHLSGSVTKLARDTHGVPRRPCPRAAPHPPTRRVHAVHQSVVNVRRTAASVCTLTRSLLCVAASHSRTLSRGSRCYSVPNDILTAPTTPATGGSTPGVQGYTTQPSVVSKRRSNRTCYLNPYHATLQPREFPRSMPRPYCAPFPYPTPSCTDWRNGGCPC